MALAGDSKSYFGLIDHNDVRSAVEASIEHATVTAGGDVDLSATEQATIDASDESCREPWTGYGAVIVTNSCSRAPPPMRATPITRPRAA